MVLKERTRPRPRLINCYEPTMGEDQARPRTRNRLLATAVGSAGSGPMHWATPKAIEQLRAKWYILTTDPLGALVGQMIKFSWSWVRSCLGSKPMLGESMQLPPIGNPSVTSTSRSLRTRELVVGIVPTSEKQKLRWKKWLPCL